MGRLIALLIRPLSRSWRILVTRVDETVTDLGYERAKRTDYGSGEPRIAENRRGGDDIEPKPRQALCARVTRVAHFVQSYGWL